MPDCETARMFHTIAVLLLALILATGDSILVSSLYSFPHSMLFRLVLYMLSTRNQHEPRLLRAPTPTPPATIIILYNLPERSAVNLRMSRMHSDVDHALMSCRIGPHSSKYVNGTSTFDLYRLEYNVHIYVTCVAGGDTGGSLLVGSDHTISCCSPYCQDH